MRRSFRKQYTSRRPIEKILLVRRYQPTIRKRVVGVRNLSRREYRWNDTGNADRLADLYGDEFLNKLANGGQT